MAKRNAPSADGKQAKKLDEIRNIIVGPRLKELFLIDQRTGLLIAHESGANRGESDGKPQKNLT